MQKISYKAAALAFGITWALYVLLIGWAGIFGWGTKAIELIASLYIGFGPSILGGIIGAVWGFIDGAIAGLIIAFIYNIVVKKKK